MNIRVLALLLLLLLAACSNSFAQQLSCDELAEVLDIKSWRVPMPKDERFEWSIEIVDYAQRKFTNINAEKLNPQQKALIALRGTGKNTYEFTLKNRAGRGQGDLEIDICTEKERRENLCDNSYSITWYDIAKPYDDGTKFVIADIIGDSPRKQIILELVKFRLEDMLKDSGSAPSTQAHNSSNADASTASL